MNITLNGQAKQIPDGLNIGGMIDQFCKNRTPVIAEVNGNIVKKPGWDEVILKNGDTIELVSFVGGG